MQIILASASPRRKELLSQVISEFQVQPADIEESFDSKLESLTAQVEDLALRKARLIAQNCTSPTQILGSDTVVVIQQEVLGKPADAEDAARMLGKLSGQWHEVITAVALIQTGEAPKELSNHAISRVKMKDLSPDEIQNYIASGEPLDKAGAYAIQGLAGVFVEKIEGSWDTIVGLPLENVKALLSAVKA
ncbi:hypothetical protein COW36_05355 [bacterium (Candidatus Blackallbacteria) CG17_big_fil_post_rev_8_21_14_2_50_48_46]|uniref:dTTP/UTP pyrophosphatase n=1 Tax=bacterium (Candidatus Blackallbacteria) CG17_big_fil_post_rev_8_21_14_2_50_48_46 TaxID=2014261 RepID=A0A2M7G7X0_9BACT|nr:MAG: hypothetical protein COW64_20950 [bacterium (Candidatus Blackallbacteria) CG18_big_fil_WC_8_21_14_2_50_49_26]PIW18196.1 MAG: hypothetical protein COW36_05355 [bacterium (Candidatus Blackallbacteria) CG17_big_fil_post_rev_8_21_14_2_50_48_46]PIW50627.1 MAG: hypothetical protein COW20_01620 [bacterium (Candidatus Blackallbacteria) CG13_big_fil_rev_8_21_14_2_50_49_14]